MSEKQLESKAISIKGKSYVLVSDRIIFFNETYKSGCIKTYLISEPNADMVVIRAQIIPDIGYPDRYFTGFSQAKWGEGPVNKTAALENCETSAVGRALAMMGIGVIDSVASVDEMEKAGVTKKVTTNSTDPASPAQQNYIMNLMRDTNTDIAEIKEKFGVTDTNRVNKTNASKVIEYLKGKGEVH